MRKRCVLVIYLVLLLACPVVSASSETEYFAVFMEGRKVGYAIHSRLVSGGTVTTTEKFNVTISRVGAPITMDATETTIETIDGKPLGFKAVQEMSAMKMEVTGTVDKQGKIEMAVKSMGAEQTSEMQWPDGAVMAEGLRLLTLKKGMKKGTKYAAKVFSPAALQAIDIRMEIGPKQNVDLLGRVVTLTEVTSRYNMMGAGEIVSTGYVDDDFRDQKVIMPLAGMQIEMVACAKEFALGENDVFEIIDKLFLASPEPLDDVRSAKSITYHISPRQGTASPAIPSGDSQIVQQLKDGKIIVTVELAAAPKGAKFPYKGTDPEILKAMKPTRFVQSDDEKIIELARQAIGDIKDAAKAARRIEAFVANYVERFDLSIGYASAVEIAASRQGDCTEFAVLTAALCRAVGIPSKVVSGIAYVDNWQGFQGFGGHAWTQAYIGDKWIDLDAAFKGSGLGGYDAGHIALAVGNGDPEGFFNLATTIGQFKIDKVVTRR